MRRSSEMMAAEKARTLDLRFTSGNLCPIQFPPGIEPTTLGWSLENPLVFGA